MTLFGELQGHRYGLVGALALQVQTVAIVADPRLPKIVDDDAAAADVT